MAFITCILALAVVQAISSLSLLTAASSPELELEREAIHQSGWWRFYGDPPSSHCEWPGITCNHAGSVTEIFQPYRNSSFFFGGKLDDMNFSSLPNLVSLSISGQLLYGSIPPEIGNLKRLEHLDLHDNTLDGHIPSEIGNLKNLSVLNLRSNNLDGSIPFPLFGLTSLFQLDLSENRLTESIPNKIGNLKGLKYLHLFRNRLSGPIPIEIGNCSQLVVLVLSYNNLN
ncbi:hypothetical protein PTKIN_Ptkin07bG0050000 [Pterospermum kingtungense]